MTESILTPKNYAIQVEGLSKSFSSCYALKSIDLQLNYGEHLAVVGPNGAGKTTLIKVLATIMNPTSGKMLIAGLNPKKNAREIRRRLGVVTHQTYFYSNLTACENLEFYSRMYDIPRNRERINEVVDMVGMSQRLHDRIGTLSRGMQQRLSIARALLHKPEIILLDEPETGLDQQALSILWQVLKGDKDKPRTVVVTTHNLEYALRFGDCAIIICKGKIVYREKTCGLDLPAFKKAYQECTGVKS